jgi:hypothetical protein
MPKKLTTPEEIQKAWEKKRERDRKAQANWVANHHDTHLERMKAQYQKTKVKKADEKKAGKEREMMGMEDRDAPAPPKVYPKTIEGVKAYKRDHADASQRQIAVALGVAQATVSRYLKK